MNEIDERTLLESEFLYLYQVESAEKALREKRKVLENLLKSYDALNNATLERIYLTRVLSNFSYENAKNNKYGKLYLDYLVSKANNFGKFLLSIAQFQEMSIRLKNQFWVKDRHSPKGKSLCCIIMDVPLFRIIESLDNYRLNVVYNPVESIKKAAYYIEGMYSSFLADKYQLAITIESLLLDDYNDIHHVNYQFLSTKKGFIEKQTSSNLLYKEKKEIIKFYQKTVLKDYDIDFASSTDYYYYDFETDKNITITNNNYREQVERLKHHAETIENVLRQMPGYGFGYYEKSSIFTLGGKTDNPSIVKPVLDFAKMAKLYPFIKCFIPAYANDNTIKRLTGGVTNNIDNDFLAKNAGILGYADANKSPYTYTDALKIFGIKLDIDKKLKEAIAIIDRKLVTINFERAVKESNSFPPYYSTIDDIHFFMFLFFNKRADTVKELINLGEQIRMQEKIIGKLDQINANVSNLSQVVKTGFANVNRKLDSIENKVKASIVMQKDMANAMREQANQSWKTNQKLDEILSQNEKHYLSTIDKLSQLDNSMKDIEEAINDIEINYNYTEINNTYDYSSNNYSYNLDVKVY